MKPRTRLRAAATGITMSALTKIHGGVDGEIANPIAGWEQDLHETHPPLRDRLALARSFAHGEAPPADDRPASVLLRANVEAAAA